MIKAVKWVRELPTEVQAELLADCERILRKHVTTDENEIDEALDYLSREKLVNVIESDCEYMPSYDKYKKYLWGEE